MKSLSILRLLLATAAFVIAGCDDEQVCSSGSTQLCNCAGGLEGAQECNTIGDGWEPCDCGSGDGDVDADTDVDGDVDGDIDGDGDVDGDGDADGDTEPDYSCPGHDDMVRVPASDTCIDKYEASQSTGGDASTEPDAEPWAEVTQTDAADACSAAGKRLCTAEEWFAACQGTEALAFPYGDAYDADACNGRDHSDAVALTGSIATCEGGLPGLFDMSGNVWEWVSDCEDGYCNTRGGSVGDVNQVSLRCDAATPLEPSASHYNVGFRCCLSL